MKVYQLFAATLLIGMAGVLLTTCAVSTCQGPATVVQGQGPLPQVVQPVMAPIYQPPVVVHHDNSGFLGGLLAGHLLSGGYHGYGYGTHTTVVNHTTVNRTVVNRPTITRPNYVSRPSSMSRTSTFSGFSRSSSSSSRSRR